MRTLIRWAVLAAVAVGVIPLVLAAEPPSRLTWTGAAVGKLDKIDNGSLTLQINVPELERINNKGNNNRGKNAGGKNKGRNNNNQPRFRLDIEQKSLKLDVAETLVVRRLELPGGFDDKGNIKQYTAQELKEKKGPGNLPGYIAARDDLRPGQIVEAFVAPGKDGKPRVVMVAIVSEPAAPPREARKK